MQIKILSEAQKDIENAIIFYESQAEGLGNIFLISIIEEIDNLLTKPLEHKKVKSFHQKLASKFPYSIYYKKDEKYIYIYGILDNRINPSKHKQRFE